MFKLNKINLQLFSEEGFEGISESSTPVETVTEELTAGEPTNDPIDDSQPIEELYPIKVRGEERQVPLEELIQLAQMGDDYTRKTQELATERKLADTLRTMGYDPMQILEDIEAQRLQEQAQESGLTPAELQLQQRLEQFERKELLTEQSKQLASMPMFNEWQEELQGVADANGWDLRTTYLLKMESEIPNMFSQIQQEKQSLQEQRGQIEQEAVKKYLEAKKKNQVGFTEGAGATPVIETHTPKSFDDAKKNSIAMLKEMLNT